MLKTLIKVSLAALLVLMLCIVGLVALAFHPMVRRAVVLRALENQPGVIADLDAIKIRPNSIEINPSFALLCVNHY